MTIHPLRLSNSIVFLSLIVWLAACDENDPTKYKSKGGTDLPAIVAVEVYQNEVPPGLPEYKGEFFQAKKWQDNNGENLLVLTTNTEVSGYDMTSKSIHGFHYTKSSGEYVLLWKMNDYENDCYFDLVCDFFPDGTTITDLDNNRIAEVKLQYKLNCSSDMGTDAMKLLMYENGKKRALRGQRWIDYDNFNNTQFPYSYTQLNASVYGKPSGGGRYENEDEFRDAPPAFLEFAQQEWVKRVVQISN